MEQNPRPSIASYLQHIDLVAEIRGRSNEASQSQSRSTDCGPTNGTIHEVPVTEGPTRSAIPSTSRGIPSSWRNGSSAKKRRETEFAVAAIKEMKISKASKQYAFDEDGVEYLDCFNGTAHVGHCHPQVVSAGSIQMATVSTAQGFKSDLLEKYTTRLSQSLPDGLNVVYMCNSGSEANDLALRLARQYTGNHDIVVTDDAFHGNAGVLVDISPKMHQYVPHYEKKDWVHITPIPDAYRPAEAVASEVGEAANYKSPEEYEFQVASKCADEVDKMFSRVTQSRQGVAAFICEPCFIVNGVFMPHPVYLEKVYATARDHGALVIADETQSGLGRTGEGMWSFESHGVVPDIVTIGRPLGNGHPVGAVITTAQISAKLGAYFSTFGGNPVSCAIGLSVLDVIHNEKLISSCMNIGKVLKVQMASLKAKHPEIIGDVRGKGLVWGIDIIGNKDDRTPDPQMARNIMYGLKAEKILVGLTGKNRNVIFLSPPMCFTIENCMRFVKTLDLVLEKHKLAAAEEKKETEAEEKDQKASLEEVIKDSFITSACIAGPLLPANRKRKQGACMTDNNVHLFAMTEKADANGESESSDEDEEAYNHNDKEAKVEAYEDVD